ncbi:cilia- and flagella-associated protein 58-like isoform X1 [Thunnus thynnus]|uniref:cilia- and flagella-associated protein 58-like isoform X1 n=1 Tax=Thunnus thynnus TaxID=8237 RepID=UPI003527D6DB
MDKNTVQKRLTAKLIAVERSLKKDKAKEEQAKNDELAQKKEGDTLFRVQVLLKEKNKFKKQVEGLAHCVKELEGQKRAADKIINEQRELLKKIDKENKQLHDDNASLKEQVTHGINVEKVMHREKEAFQNELKKREKSLENVRRYKKKIDDGKLEIHKRDKQIKVITYEKEKLFQKNVELQERICCLEDDKSSLAAKIVQLEEKVEKQYNSIEYVKMKLNKVNNKKTQLEDKCDKDTRIIKNREDEVTNSRLLVHESEKKMRQQKVQTEAAVGEIMLLQKNLDKVNLEIEDKNKTIKKLTDGIRSRGTELNRKSQELETVQRSEKCLQNRVIVMEKQLTEIKQTHEELVVSADREQSRLRKELDHVTEERDIFIKKSTYSDNMVLQQQLKMDQQKHAEETLKQELKDCEIKFNQYQAELDHLNLELSISRHNELTLMRKVASLQLKNPQDNNVSDIMRLQRLHDYNSHLMKNLERMSAKLAEKDQEITNLKSMLARRPDDATQKFQESQRAIRELKDKLKASTAEAWVFMDKYSTVTEQNNRLKGELKELYIRDKSSNKPLPPISKKSQLHSEKKPEDGSKITPHPPMKVYGTQVRPQPPPPHHSMRVLRQNSSSSTRSIPSVLSPCGVMLDAEEELEPAAGHDLNK